NNITNSEDNYWKNFFDNNKDELKLFDEDEDESENEFELNLNLENNNYNNDDNDELFD
ncbi:18139_t:CDS:1, partial [Cetraspora pellucida]